MADTTTDRYRTETEAAERQGPTGHHEHDSDSARSTTMGVIAVIAGALGVVAGIIPNLGVGALILAAIALATGIPSMRRGPGDRGFRWARIGVVLGVIAVLLGILNIAIQLEAFDYFTGGGDNLDSDRDLGGG